MTTPSFLDTLRSEVARMQAVHPEREGELARAHALIRLGMVSPSPDDPELGQVLSSDGHKVYHVNGVCDCDAGQHGQGCKHVHGWRLYQYVEKKLAAKTSQTAQDPTATSPTPVETAQVSDAPTALPEAPASANCHVMIEGRQVQITLRDTDEGRLLARLAVLLKQYPALQGPEKAQPQGPGKDWCGVHATAMRWNEGRGGRKGWYSHKAPDGQWCKGR